MIRSILLRSALLVPALACCAREPDGYEIRGRIVDAETREPVSRESLDVHLFNDSVKAQTSLVREDEAGFRACMPAASVRLRVVDRTKRYEFFERQFEVPSSGLDYVVELVPTHFVLVKGRLLENGKPPHIEEGIIGGAPLLGFAWEGDSTDADYSSDDGSFEIRLPRTRVRVQMLDTGLSPVPAILDLTAVDADVVVQDIRLTPR